MQGISGLLDDIAVMLRACPGVVSELGGNTNAVMPYIDVQTSEANSLMRNVYTMPNGSVLIAWEFSGIARSGMEGWSHRVDIYVRAMRRRSPLDLLNAILDGTPQNEAIRWRYLCVNDATLPVEIQEVVRLTDEEATDYFVIRTVFHEKGDDPYGMPG